MRQQLIRGVLHRQNSRFDALIYKAMSIGRWQDNDTGIALLGEAINAVVVILVVHPEVVFIYETCL